MLRSLNKSVPCEIYSRNSLFVWIIAPDHSLFRVNNNDLVPYDGCGECLSAAARIREVRRPQPIEVRSRQVIDVPGVILDRARLKLHEQLMAQRGPKNAA